MNLGEPFSSTTCRTIFSVGSNVDTERWRGITKPAPAFSERGVFLGCHHVPVSVQALLFHPVVETRCDNRIATGRFLIEPGCILVGPPTAETCCSPTSFCHAGRMPSGLDARTTRVDVVGVAPNVYRATRLRSSAPHPRTGSMINSI